ncbi:chemotaxis protein CheA [Longirhabdus pacifica]|uniref:chemotaxis protein CheA n=1 Tax=Longirhabdus pacifica TaxID=2305227 RepID=UPI00100937D9|nr:chemotaxis protein CheA [Longirhabdus pacifica]
MDINQYLPMFIEETTDHLQSMNDMLLQLESDHSNLQIVNDIFRSAHTLKGMSATMGFNDIADLTHEMENVLGQVREKQLAVSSTLFDLFFSGLDKLEQMLQDVIDGGQGKLDNTELIANLRSLNDSSQQSMSSSQQDELDEYQKQVLIQALESNMSVFYLTVQLESSCQLKTARAYMVFNQLEKSGEIIHCIPSVEHIEQQLWEETELRIYYIGNTNQQKLQDEIYQISEIKSVQCERLKMDQLKKDASKNELEETEQKDKSTTSKGNQKQGGVAGKTIRVDIERLDQLMNLFSEMLIDRVRLQSMAESIGDSNLTETVDHMSRISVQLQDIVLKLRMVTIDSVFSRFPRMIRDIAKQLNKKVDLVMEGADTELDRTLVNEIGDPLVHLLRNAIDHGIEKAEDRLAKGKDEVGKIFLRAYHSGDNIFIEIEEDGAGIDPEKIKSLIVERGILTEEVANELKDEEVYPYLFHAGFSTAEKVTDLSGRGVGLDVVKSKIDALGGDVSIESALQKGTKFTIRLPLTLSIITAIRIVVSDEKYVLPITSVIETAAIKKDQVKNVHGIEMYAYRDMLIPVIYVHRIFDIVKKPSNNDDLDIVIIRKGKKYAALVVDEVLGQQEIVIKSLGQYLTNVPYISGATILGDGEVSLIIDPNSFIS